MGLSEHARVVADVAITSHAADSTLVTALPCTVEREKLHAAPFGAQNVSLNSAVTLGGG